MTKQEIQILIETLLVGKNYDLYENALEVKRSLLKYCGGKEIGFDYDRKTQVGYITYRRKWLIGFEIKKEKGEYLYLSHYAWKVKSVRVFDWFENLDDRFAEIDKRIESEKQAENETKQRNIDNFKKIRALFPDIDSAWRFKDMLKGVSEVVYDEFNKEAKQ